jgi:FAD synthetase
LAHRKTVLATGVFDILHPGHVRFLEESKKRGGPGARLVVVVARDKTVLKRKGRRPVLPESDRREIVSLLKPVNRAVLGHEEVDFLGVLEELRPDIVCVGYDQNDIKTTVKKLVTAQKLPIRVVQIAKFGRDGLNSSTGVKKRIARDWPRASSSR